MGGNSEACALKKGYWRFSSWCHLYMGIPSSLFFPMGWPCAFSKIILHWDYQSQIEGTHCHSLLSLRLCLRLPLPLLPSSLSPSPLSPLNKGSYLAQADLKFTPYLGMTSILPPLPYKFWDYRHLPPHLIYEVLRNQFCASWVLDKHSTN